VPQLEVVPVRGTRALRQFLDLPYSLYANDPYWVPPLRIAQKQLFDRKEHPFYRHGEIECFLALRDGRVAGRIAAILDRNYNEYHGDHSGFFGFFESERSQAVADALFAAASMWLKDHGAQVIRGPVNPSTNYECGLLVDGFDSCPYLMMPHNPPYYAELVERAGFRKAKDLYAHLTDPESASGALERLQRLEKRMAAENRIRVRSIRKEAFDEDVALAWQVYNASWSRNWGFVPMTRDEFCFMARDMKSILVPDLVLFGEVDGKVVGFALGLPDINRALKHAGGRLFPLGLLKILYHKRSIRSFRVVALGVVEQYRTAGVAAGFYLELLRRAMALGYRECEMSWVLEDNTLMNRSIEALGGRRYKTYRIYEWN
jgi:GNAT superfamily N-acetyltransferase